MIIRRNTGSLSARLQALGITLLLAAAGCGDDNPDPQLGTITPAELNDALQAKDFLLINVHVPNAGEIPGTDTHIPYDDIEALVAYIGTDLDTPVVIYCLSDTMTLIAGPELVDRGYRDVRYLTGGMTAWTQAGYTLDP
ncbi:MAG: rhodanese-like domain-containing protein [bacterium]